MISLGVYENDLRLACLCCKRAVRPYLTAALSDLLCRREAAQLRAGRYDLVIPAPHHWWNRLWTAQHPADRIAERLGRFLMVPVSRHILVKTRWTRKQASLSTSARRRNVKSAFGIAGRRQLDGLRILLTDDVLTTGATASSAAGELLAAGAERVDVAVLARVCDA